LKTRFALYSLGLLVNRIKGKEFKDQFYPS